jgi:hypothetical protein
MAKRKKGSKVQTRAKLRRRNSAKGAKAHKVSKPKRAPVKKAARKEVAPAVESVAIESVEQPAPSAAGTSPVLDHKE